MPTIIRPVENCSSNSKNKRNANQNYGENLIMCKVCKDEKVWGWRSRKIHALVMEIKMATPLRGNLSKICSILYLDIHLDPGIWLLGIYANDKSTKEFI